MYSYYEPLLYMFAYSQSCNIHYSIPQKMLEFTLWMISFSSITQHLEAELQREHTMLTTKEFMSMLKDAKRYNKYATPTQDEGCATNVSMSMYIEGISSFSAKTMDYQLDVYFYQEWTDERLKHNESGPLLIRDRTIFDKIWHPDLYFANARHASFQEITEDNFCVNIYPDGRVWYDCRISLVAICTMDLWKYPLDTQICELRILSYAYPETHLRLRWAIQAPIDRNMDIKMPDMNLVGIETGVCNGTYPLGVWSCMTAVFFVERAMLHHVIQTYLPTALIVIISWFNFWLDIDSAPARVLLSIHTMLTISTQANAVKLALPEVSYMKAIDAWMGMCMAFVFAVNVEYTMAHFAKNQEHLFQFSQQTKEAPLVVDSETLNSILGGTTMVTEPIIEEEEPEESISEQVLNQIITNEHLHRRWRKRCEVLANGNVMGSKKIRINQDEGYTNDRDSAISSTIPEEEMRKLSRNHLSPDFSFIRHSPFSDEERPPTMQRKNSFRESAKVIKNQMNRRTKRIKRTLYQLRGREMANKIDEKSRILFPVAFVFMNIFYWTFYMVLN